MELSLEQEHKIYAALERCIGHDGLWHRVSISPCWHTILPGFASSSDQFCEVCGETVWGCEYEIFVLQWRELQRPKWQFWKTYGEYIDKYGRLIVRNT